MQLVRMLTDDDRALLTAGDLIAVVTYAPAASEELTVIKRVTDGWDPGHNINLTQVEAIPGVALRLYPPTGMTHAVFTSVAAGLFSAPLMGWSHCGNVLTEALIEHATENPTDRHKELREFKLCGTCRRSNRWQKATRKKQ